MNNEVKVEIKRPGRPPLDVKKKRPPRKAIRPPDPNSVNRLQCSRCLVHYSRENYSIKRNGEYYKNCLRCAGIMREYAKKYRAMKTLKKEE